MQTELKSLEAQIQSNTQSPVLAVSEQPQEVRENGAGEANTATYSRSDELSSPKLTEGVGIRYVWSLGCAILADNIPVSWVCFSPIPDGGNRT